MQDFARCSPPCQQKVIRRALFVKCTFISCVWPKTNHSYIRVSIVILILHIVGVVLFGVFYLLLIAIHVGHLRRRARLFWLLVDSLLYEARKAERNAALTIDEADCSKMSRRDRQVGRLHFPHNFRIEPMIGRKCMIEFVVRRRLKDARAQICKKLSIASLYEPFQLDAA